jgi:transposase
MKDKEINWKYEEAMKKALGRAKIEKEPSKQTSLNKFSNTKEVIEKVKQKYTQAWPQYNAAKTRERLISEELLLELLDNLQEPRHFMGRRPFNIKEKILCMFIYCYGGYSSRRTMSEIEIAKRRKLLTKTPHFNSVLNMFRDSSLTKTLFNLVEITALPLRQFEETFSVDASGFSSCFYERWFDVRTQSNSKRKKWMKLNLIVGNRTNVVVSLLVYGGNRHESKGLPKLVKNTSRFFNAKEISADKGYLSNKNLNAISGIGAIPFIPFKSNTSNVKRGRSLWKAMFQYFKDHNEDFLKHYHKRSNSETAFSMIKRNFRSYLRTKTFTSQVNELLVLCLCHNLGVLVQESFELGLDIDLNECYLDYLKVVRK